MLCGVPWRSALRVFQLYGYMVPDGPICPLPFIPATAQPARPAAMVSPSLEAFMGWLFLHMGFNPNSLGHHPVLSS